MTEVLDQIFDVCFPHGKPAMESLLDKGTKVSLLDKVVAMPCFTLRAT